MAIAVQQQIQIITPDPKIIERSRELCRQMIEAADGLPYRDFRNVYILDREGALPAYGYYEFFFTGADGCCEDWRFLVTSSDVISMGEYGMRGSVFAEENTVRGIDYLAHKVIAEHGERIIENIQEEIFEYSGKPHC